MEHCTGKPSVDMAISLVKSPAVSYYSIITVLLLLSSVSGWQKQYENDLYKLLADSGLTVTPAMKELVLGGEVAMWAEQTDSFSIESKVIQLMD